MVLGETWIPVAFSGMASKPDPVHPQGAAPPRGCSEPVLGAGPVADAVNPVTHCLPTLLVQSQKMLKE